MIAVVEAEAHAFCFIRLTFGSFLVRLWPGRIHFMKQILHFLCDDQGQDLIEYTLLMAFVALASAALFIGAGGSISGIWSTSNSQLSAANGSAS
jgi:Flp pilus assembly pilin Flp